MVPDVNLEPFSQFTMMMWYKTDNAQEGDILMQVTSGSNDRIVVDVLGGFVRARGIIGAANSAYRLSDIPVNSVWTHIGLTWSPFVQDFIPQGFTFFKNGQQRFSTSNVVPTLGSGSVIEFAIGHEYIFSDPLLHTRMFFDVEMEAIYAGRRYETGTALVLDGVFYQSKVFAIYDCKCNTCFSGTGTVCTDVDECEQAPCDENADCDNTPGDYKCTCNSGYSGDGITCTDVDECKEDPCDENAECDNTPGAYTCTCNSGYSGNGVTCTDVDECDEDPCGVNARCDNTP
eukprot:3933656-Rhodomonas_salina.1